jgi:predicted RNA methylase
MINNYKNDKQDKQDKNDKQDKGLKRNIIDKFYTKSTIVKKCIKNVKKYIKINKNDIIIEPSAGNGAFIKNIKTLSNNYIFYDLTPEHKNIIKKDFLKLNLDKLKNKYDNIHIIGNPPFGRQSSLAIKFIKKCCEFAKSISFILPKSFKKDSMKKHFSLNYHLIIEIDLPENSFLINNIETDVPCIFQIWKYKRKKRKQIKKLIPYNFEFVKKTDNPDISFRRVGVNAGKIDEEIEDKSIQSHYFIKFKNNLTINENIKKINKIKFIENNTVGPKSISKQELIKEFNELLC